MAVSSRPDFFGGSCARAFHFFFFYGYVAHRDLHSFPTRRSSDLRDSGAGTGRVIAPVDGNRIAVGGAGRRVGRSEEHTSELQSLTNLVCRLLLVKKKLG